MAQFIDLNGNYYEGDQARITDIIVTPRPTPTSKWDMQFNMWVEDPAMQAEAAAEAQLVADRKTVLADPTVKALIAMTPAQVDNYINTNVTDLQSAKVVLAIIGKLLRTLAVGAING